MPTTADLRRWWTPACRGPWARINLHGEGRITVRASTVDAFLALNDVLVRWNYRTRRRDTGAYNCRPITGGSGWSLHAYGIAADFNWTTNPYGPRLVTDMPAAMVAEIEALRTNDGARLFRWGGRYRGNKDAMHYEIFCSPGSIATGIANRPLYPPPIPKPVPPPPGAPMTPEGTMVYLVRCNIEGAPEFGSVYALTPNWERIPVRGEDYVWWINWCRWLYKTEVQQVSDLGDWMRFIYTTKPREGPNNGRGGYPT